MTKLLPLPPAGFWQRGVAWSIDAALVAPLSLLATWRWVSPAAQDWSARAEDLLQLAGQAMGAALLGGLPLPQLPAAIVGAPGIGQALAALDTATRSSALPLLLAYAGLGAAYHVSCERSRWQGSFGKRLLGLRACDRRGGPLGVAAATLRYLASSLSWATLNLGHLIAAVPPRHVALHDHCSGTRVMAGTTRLPGWARAWLALLAVAGLVTTVWIARTATVLMGTGFEQAL